MASARGRRVGTERLCYSFGLIDLLPDRRREHWQDSPDGSPKEPAGNRWATSQAMPPPTARKPDHRIPAIPPTPAQAGHSKITDQIQ